jgi:D-tyrosyl-tRNA(Tyr) deacylase
VIALLQRVRRAAVEVGGVAIGRIESGSLALVCATRGDGPAEAQRLADRVLAYRMFSDDRGRMNRSLVEVSGALLAVPQFTLAADTRSGLRPRFDRAAPPEEARLRFDEFVAAASAKGIPVATGRFGADMQVSLLNDGPVTFWLEVAPPGRIETRGPDRAP